MQRTPRKKIVIASIILLVLIAGLVFVFVVASSNVRTYRETLAIITAQIASSEKKIAHMVTISNLMKNRTQDIQRIQHIAVDPKRPLQFIETIEQIGRATNVKIALTVNEKEDDVQALLFHATLEGNEKDVRAMLSLIQQLPYQIKISNILFKRDVPAGSNPKQIVLSTMTRLILTLRVATQ